VARILIIGGGCRGRLLGSMLVEDGHAVRATTRSEAGRAAIEAAGGECWIGTPERLATLRGALDAVTIACWLLGTASGPQDEVAPLHGTRLELFLTQAIDTTVRGVLYEAAGTVAPELLQDGADTATRLAAASQIPLRVLREDPAQADAWALAAHGAIAELLVRA